MSYRQPARLEPVEELVVDAWNVGHALGRGARLAYQLRNLTRGADVIVLMEAARYTKLLRVALAVRWIIYRAHVPGSDRSSDVVALVHRRRVPRPSIHTIGHTTPWVGPKGGIRHRGRSWPVLEWANLKLIGVHRTPGGPQGGTSPRIAGANRPAWLDDLEALAVELEVERPYVTDQGEAIVGDQNGKRGELKEYAVELGLIVRYALGVDHGATYLVDADAEVLPKGGSDHHRIRWTLTPRARA